MNILLLENLLLIKDQTQKQIIEEEEFQKSYRSGDIENKYDEKIDKLSKLLIATDDVIDMLYGC